MRRTSYRDLDTAFGQMMVTLRTAITLTQTELAEFLGVSRRAIGAWEGGVSYPKALHLRQFIALGVDRAAFPAGQERDQIRALWVAAHTKELLDEDWLTGLLRPLAQPVAVAAAHAPPASALPGAQRTPSIVLPYQPTSFIGRITEVAQVARNLEAPICRLLTLVGPGGAGKTRLAIEAAAASADSFADGGVFVALASVDTPDQIVSAIGDALNLSFAGRFDAVAHLLAYLHDRQMLLVLDNFEHLLDGADIVDRIVRHTPRITVLVTSRERLNLQSEWLYDINGLAYPPAEVDAGWSTYSAVQLFVQRALQIRPGLPMTDSTLATVGRICQHVAGMPLAIELAAATTRMMSIDDLEGQLGSSLDLLSTRLRDVPERHRSMRSVIDHSWNLLAEPERALFSRLAVFRGGCTADGAAAVTGASLSALLALVEKSLLSQTEAPGESPVVETRFILLEPIRAYARDKLVARGETEALRRAHASYYVALAESASAQWETPTANTALAALDNEHDNMRAALRWVLDGGDLLIGLQLGAALARFWRSRVYLSEGRAWLNDLLALPVAEGDAALMSARLRAMQGAAWLAADQHDYPAAARLFEDSVALGHTLKETEANTNLMLNSALHARAVGQYGRALGLLEDALIQHRAAGDRGSLSGGMGFSLYELALVVRELGDFSRSVALVEECMALHRSLGDHEGVAQGMLGLSDVARDTGDAAAVRLYAEQCLATFREVGTQWGIGFSLNNLAYAAALEGDLTLALAYAEESEALFRRQQADVSRAEVLLTLARIWRAQGDATAAYHGLKEALNVAWVLGPRLMVPLALEGLAGLLAETHRDELAVRLLAAAASLRADMGTPVRPIDRPDVDTALATVQAALGAEAFAAAWAEASAQPVDSVVGAI